MSAPSADHAAALGSALRRAQERIGDALDQYAIGYDTAAWGLPVDWEHVARRMAEALGWTWGTSWERGLPAPRDFTRPPEDDDADPELTRRMGDGH